AEQEQLRQILPAVLAETRRERGEVPFAVSPKGEIFAADPADLPRLRGLGLAPANGDANAGSTASGDWVIVTRRDPASGFTLGTARPVGDALKEIRNTAVRNLGWGLALVVLALFGIRPLADNMTRGVRTLTEGAERLAGGDLTTRVPVGSKDEIGRLSATFNRMAEELAAHQDRRLAEERLHKERGLCRRIQEEMLPREPLRVGFAEVAGISIPAREVGGDFFNYFLLPGDEAAILVGDVSGKGVAAALLMANLQAKLRGELALAPDLAPPAHRLPRPAPRGPLPPALPRRRRRRPSAPALRERGAQRALSRARGRRARGPPVDRTAARPSSRRGIRGGPRAARSRRRPRAVHRRAPGRRERERRAVRGRAPPRRAPARARTRTPPPAPP